MFDKYKIDIKWVQTDDEWDELYTGVHSVPLGQSPFHSYSSIIEARNSPRVNFYNVYYENTLIGYMFLDHRTTVTVEFHWGVINKHRYLMKIIESSFEACKAVGVKNFIGTIPVENLMSAKIAQRLGFDIIDVINNYFEDGRSMLMVKYEVI